MSLKSALPRSGAVRFLLHADAEPGLLPRLLQPFAKRDLIPARMSSWRDGATMHVEILVVDAEPGDLSRIAGNLCQVVGVRALRQVAEPAMQAA